MRPIVYVPLKFGAIGAALIMTMFLVFYFSGENPMTKTGTFDLFILPIFIFFGLKEFRETYNDKMLEFWEGMSVGFLVYFTVAFISALFIFLFVELFDPKILTEYLKDSLNLLDENKDKIVEEMGTASFDESREKVSQTTAFDLALDGFLKKLIVGLMLTSLTSVILKRSVQKV